MSKDKITSLLDFIQEQNEEGNHLNWLEQRALNLLKAKNGENKFLDLSKDDLMAIKGIANEEKPEAAKAILLNYLQSIIDISNKCDMSVEEVLDELDEIMSLKEKDKSE